MTETFPAGALQELVRRGLLATQPAPEPLPGGNADRRDSSARSSWRVGLPDGRSARLMLGTGLADLARRQRNLAAAGPALVPAVIFHESLGGNEAFAEEFFAGRALGATENLSSAEQAAFARICARLASTTQASTEAARLAEWQEWCGTVEALGSWTPEERALLRTSVWPRLYPLLTIAPPVVRWSNGDFTSANFLVNEEGEGRLIDCEFARETHFFAEDAARFHALSPLAWRQPEIFSGTLPRPGPAWQLYFWLRQLVLESLHNSDAYLARIRPLRLGVIRRLAEQLLDAPLAGWSVAAAPLHHALETARWEQTATSALRLSGWCYSPGPGVRAIVVTEGDTTLATAILTARPDVQAHFAGTPGAQAAGFNLTVPLREPDLPLVLSALVENGALLPFHSFRARELPGRGPWAEDYVAWAALYDPDPPPPAVKIPGPLFSILLPVYNPPAGFLRACLESVRRQHYSQWELCVVDDGSTAAGVPELLREFAVADPRIRVQRRPANGGIACATNDALRDARGEFIVLLDHDDILRPHALAEFAGRLHREPALDALYSDEDIVTAAGGRFSPFLKPDFSPEFLLGVMYIGHALCVRTAVARRAGGFDAVFDGMQDYEFFLRVTEQTRRIGHIPRMLYHWRQSPSSSALHGNIKGNIDEKQAAAVRAHLQRTGRTERVHASGRHRVQLQPTVIPTTEIVRPATGALALDFLQRAAEASSADVLVLMTVEPRGAPESWLPALAALAQRPDSGLVAPVMITASGSVMESGWTSGPQGPVPVMRGFDSSGDGYNGSLRCTREVALVSSACCAVRRELARSVLATAPAGESWGEFCHRLRAQGMFHRVCATARFEPAGSWVDPISGHVPGAEPDPFFNPHFDARRADYALAQPPAHLPTVRWHLDTPFPDQLPDGCLHLSGWCFSLGRAPIRAIRLRANALTFFGTTGLPRPDVRTALPAAPGDATGFEVRGLLPPGRNNLILEAEQSDGHWICLKTGVVEVPRRLRPLWLGGGTWSELLSTQMPVHGVHPPVPLVSEKFPAPERDIPRPKISVVTPSYQQGRFLPETLHSVLGQSEINCEYVVQDGGSTDGSAELIRQHATRLKAWASAPDGGQADAIMRGFAQTSGAPDDLMAWINSDDFYQPGALAFVADHFARHPDVDVLYGHRVLVDESSRETGRWFLPAHEDEVLRLYDLVPQETMFWRRRIWDRVGGLNRSFRFALDWDLLLRFLAAGARMVRVPYFLACFRLHPAQKTSAAMHGIGQQEIDLLRARTFGRPLDPVELEKNPALLRYLRRSARLAAAWKIGVRLRS